MFSKRSLMVSGALVLGLGTAVWFGRAGLLARYYTYRLLKADDAGVAAWVQQASAWGDGVHERLLDGFRQDDAEVCDRCASALAQCADDWPADDPRRAVLVRQLAERLGAFSGFGRVATFDCAAKLVRVGPTAMRPLLRAGLGHDDAAVRLRAAALALRPEISAAELLLPAMKDGSADVRRAALLAVGPSRMLIADDDLLAWLHDPDAEVRRLCETALRGRGLRAKDVQLGRLLTSPQPVARLQLLALLADDSDLDLGAWLNRLSQDPSPAVRAAAARLAGEQQVMPMAERLEQMARSDNDLTVRPIALYHWRQLQAVRPAGGSAPRAPDLDY